MNTEIDLARERVITQVLDADSLPEIEAAKKVLDDWLTAHPEEQGMRDGFEQLYTIQEIIEEETKLAMGEGNPPQPYGKNAERQRILDQALDARTFTEIAVATKELNEWVRENPNDIGIREAFEGLSLMRDIAEKQEAERTSSHREVVSAGQAA